VSVIVPVNVAEATLGNLADHWPHHFQNKGEFRIKSPGEICISSTCFQKGSHYSLKCRQDLAVGRALCL